jgi:hypothetical protein
MRFILLGFLFVGGLFTSGATAQTLTYRDVGLYVFSLEGEIYTIHELIREEPPGTEFRNLLRAGRRNDFYGELLTLSGTTLLVGSLLSLIDDEQELFWETVAIGAGMVGVGIPLERRGNRRVQEAVDWFNSGRPLGRLPDGRPRVQIGMISAGAGFVLSF